MYKITPAAYIFTHQYLNTMQQGIQSAHVVAELFVNAHIDPDMPSESITNDQRTLQGDTLSWAETYKTLRILNGGVGESFSNTYKEAKRLASKYELPFAEFFEPDINDMMTAFGFIVHPSVIFDIESEREESIARGFDTDEYLDSHELVSFLKSLRSAK